MRIKIFYLSILISVLFVSPADAQTQIIDNNLQIGNYPSTIGWGKYLKFGGSSYNSDEMFIARYSVDSSEKTDLRVGIGDDQNGDDRFVIGNSTWNSPNVWREFFVVTNQGRVGINGVSNPAYQLEVNGTIRAKEIVVETGWADFVFQPEYQLPSLAEVEAHIKEYKHLPNIPSEAEVLENGVSLGEMNVKLLQKIEELTLYTIQQQKLIEELGEKVEKLENLQK